jgi:hypothetical protein
MPHPLDIQYDRSGLSSRLYPGNKKIQPDNAALKPGLLRDNFRRKDFMRKITTKNKLIWGFTLL